MASAMANRMKVLRVLFWCFIFGRDSMGWGFEFSVCGSDLCLVPDAAECRSEKVDAGLDRFPSTSR